MLRAKNFNKTPPQFIKTTNDCSEPNPNDLDYNEPVGFKMNPQTKMLVSRLNLLTFKCKNLLFTENGIGKRESNSEEIDLKSSSEENNSQDLDDIDNNQERGEEEEGDLDAQIDIDEIEKKLKI